MVDAEPMRRGGPGMDDQQRVHLIGRVWRDPRREQRANDPERDNYSAGGRKGRPAQCEPDAPGDRPPLRFCLRPRGDGAGKLLAENVPAQVAHTRILGSRAMYPKSPNSCVSMVTLTAHNVPASMTAISLLRAASSIMRPKPG